MRKLYILLAVLLLNSAAFSQETPYVPGEIIVMMEKGGSPHTAAAILSRTLAPQLQIEVNACLSERSSIYLLSFTSTLGDDAAILNKTRQMTGVRAAQFNHFVTERATLPNDPSIGTQWHHVNVDGSDIDSDLAWDITTGGTTAIGDEIVVCVIEPGGSNYNHNDLIANHWTNTAEIPGNGIDDDGNGFVDDVNGWNPAGNNDNVGTGNHGTAVSGMIGAKGNNGIGGSGVNWDVKIMQVRVGSLTEANVIAAYNYPYVMRNLYNTTGGAQGALVVATNASWGIDNANPNNYPVWCAYYDDLGEVGILNCGATANNNVNIDVVGDMPTACGSDYMIAVTATNNNDVRTFSGYGQTTIDLGAPGESVYLPSGSTAYSNTSGTSFASPCVAGGIALVYSTPCPDLAALTLSNPQLAADQVRDYIFNGVDIVGNLIPETVTGGRLNVRNSIDLALANCGPLPDCDPVDLSLSSSCIYNEIDDIVEAEITLDVTLSENWCNATSVCYQANGQNVVCDDLVALGINLNNANNYTLYGLASNTTYTVYYTTANGTSSSVAITTGNCAALIPGCTNSAAINYNPSATFDNGSCDFPCTQVTFSITTDCWGYESSWNIVDGDGATVVSVPFNTYGNNQTYTWTGCLEWGCYTFTILDSFGDGLAGIASGCGQNGDYSLVDNLGNTLLEMGAPNFGSTASHAFCVPVDLPGCTDVAACNYNEFATVDNGSCTYPDGCTDAGACNYNPAATCDDGSCTYNFGCTDIDACNYDPAATCDSGCEYESCASCLGDFNNDGFRTVADLLMLMSEFGCVSNCAYDLDGNDFINAADMVIFLSLFATACD